MADAPRRPPETGSLGSPVREPARTQDPEIDTKATAHRHLYDGRTVIDPSSARPHLRPGGPAPAPAPAAAATGRSTGPAPDERETDPRAQAVESRLEAPRGFPPPAETAPGQKTHIWVSTLKRPTELDPRMILLREPDSPRAAAYRVLRHRLFERRDPRVIVVSSAESREGKTTCAVNLALALGEANRARVLLVEANLRAPALAALLGFLPPECFGEQLARHRERPLDPWSVVEVFSPSLHVAAVKPGAPVRPLTDGPALAIAIERLRLAGYDYVVIDTPPVLGSADVNLVCDAADGVLLVGWARRSVARSLRRACEQLGPATLLGLALLDGQ